MTIDGSGQTITINGANSVQVLSVNSGATLSLNDLNVIRGVSGFGGGAIIAYGNL